MKKYHSLFLILGMLATLHSCKAPKVSGGKAAIPPAGRHTTGVAQDRNFYGLTLNGRKDLLSYYVPDSVNRRAFRAIKQAYIQEGWLPETHAYITPRTITQAQRDSLKAFYFPQALKAVAIFSDTSNGFLKERWARRIQVYREREKDPGVSSQAEFPTLRPVNVIPIFKFANRIVDFYEQDPATRNIMDYLQLLPGEVIVVMADSSGTPVILLPVTTEVVVGSDAACKDYTDKMTGFSFLDQRLCRVPGFDVAFIREGTLYSLELRKGTQHVRYSGSEQVITSYIHEVSLYDVQDAYNRISNIMKQYLEINIERHEKVF